MPSADRPGSAQPDYPGDTPVARHDDGANRADVAAVLRTGGLELTGRLTQASNVTLLAAVDSPDGPIDCVYKPVRGERPLWDFPDGTLAAREYAAYLVSDAAGWHCVPTTVLRDGPLGPGMVQEWVPDADPDLTSGLFGVDDVPHGWLPVLSADDAEGRPLVLAHADVEALQVLAAFDLVVNNADRKASHILSTADGAVRGVDHGVTFHSDDKVRSILWGWAGRPMPGAALAGLAKLADALAGELGRNMADLLTPDEMDAFAARVAAVTKEPRYPTPPDDRMPIPWPPL